MGMSAGLSRIRCARRLRLHPRIGGADHTYSEVRWSTEEAKGGGLLVKHKLDALVVCRAHCEAQAGQSRLCALMD